MDSLWNQQKLGTLYSTIANYYDALNNGIGYPGGSYSEWQTYLVGHFGGFSLQTNRSSIWQALQKDMYDRNYLNRNLVFNQQLGIPAKVTSPTWIATSFLGTNQYISIPVLWRNYYDIVGFHRNKYSGELWLEPRLIDSLNHHLENAFVFSPEGNATISCTLYSDSYQNQEIVFKPDQPLSVSALYVRDLYADSLNSITVVKVNGADTEFSRENSGNRVHVKLHWSGTIPVGGITIQIEGSAKPGAVKPSAPEGLEGNVVSPSQILLKWRASSEQGINYIVEGKNGDSFQTLATISTGDTTYLDTGLLPSTAYTYRVRISNAQFISDPSSEISATTNTGGKGEVVLALNAGGSTYQSSSGIQYIGDASSGWVSGGTAYSTTDTIGETQDDVLYQSERYGANFSYTIPATNGFYDVVLKFAEIYQTSPKTRLFNVDCEGERVISNFDIYFRTGKDKAYDVVVPLEITDGGLNISFSTITDNAKISGLEIRHQGSTGVENLSNGKVPTEYMLSQNYPNPFNPTTEIQFSIVERRFVSLKVYDMLGREVETLVNEQKSPGTYTIEWNASSFPSGIYFYRLQAGNFSETKKLMFLK